MANVTASIQLGYDTLPQFETKLKPDGAGGERLVDFVNYMTMSDPPSKMQRQVRGMRPDNREGADPHSYIGANIRAIWAVVGPAYDDYKSKTVRELSGTPIETWDELGKLEGAFALAKTIGIRTIEQFRDAPDIQIGRLDIPDRLGWRAKAGRYLEQTHKTATAVAQDTARSEVAALSAQMAAQNEQIGLLMNKLADMQITAEDEPVRRRGRPPKSDYAAHTDADTEAA